MYAVIVRRPFLGTCWVKLPDGTISQVDAAGLQRLAQSYTILTGRPC